MHVVPETLCRRKGGIPWVNLAKPEHWKDQKVASAGQEAAGVRRSGRTGPRGAQCVVPPSGNAVGAGPLSIALSDEERQDKTHTWITFR